MDGRDGPICHPVWRPISGLIELTPWGQFDDPQPSQRPILHKISDTPSPSPQTFTVSKSEVFCIYNPCTDKLVMYDDPGIRLAITVLLFQ